MSAQQSMKIVLEPVDVLHVDIEGGFGGSSRSLRELVIALISEVPNQRVLLKTKGPSFEIYEKHAVSVEVFPKVFSWIPLKQHNTRNLISGLSKLHDLIAFCRHLLRQNVNVIHFNHDGLLFAAAVVKLMKPKQKIIIHSRYEWPKNLFSKIFAKFLNFGSDKIIAISKAVQSSLVTKEKFVIGRIQDRLKHLNISCGFVELSLGLMLQRFLKSSEWYVS
jgi:hypothetical protein